MEEVVKMEAPFLYYNPDNTWIVSK